MNRRSLLARPLFAALIVGGVLAGAGTPRPVAASSAPPTSGGDEVSFPIVVEHKFGATTVEQEPQRVVSVGYRDQDFLLALGVVPVGIRDWYGDQPHGVWPWAQDRLGDATPELMGSAELNFEAIAALDPDLIVGVTSGMTDQEFGRLSEIAPTIAQPGEFPDFGTPWQDTTLLIGEAVGRPADAASVVAGVEQRIADVRAGHPEFAGATATVAFAGDDGPGAYTSTQARSRLLVDLGFEVPVKYDELAGDEFYFTLSPEELATIDTDVIVWITPSSASVEAIRALVLRTTMTAYAEGREVLTDEVSAGAFAFTSPLSIGYVLDVLTPDLAAAVDGDPTTEVSSAAELYG